MPIIEIKNVEENGKLPIKNGVIGLGEGLLGPRLLACEVNWRTCE
jgi:hypothetical protein